MRATVTGGAGFSGSHLVDALMERGDTVTVIDNLSSGHTARLPADTDGIRHAALRMAYIYGPRQDPPGEAGVIGIFCGLIAEDTQPIVYAPARRGELQCSVLDVTAAPQELEWTAGIPLEDGISRVYEWVDGGRSARAAC